MNYFDMYIYLIVAVKVGFILMAASHQYYKIKGKENTSSFKKAKYWKERFEFIFIFLMALLLIYLFNPRNIIDQPLNYETKLLLYLFGFILIITAKWELFFKEAVWFKNLQKMIGNDGSR